ncbi:MAG TPA: hypothetical protein VKA30_00635 [Actinomycetota bacterium]|nr:hypothetical protein [Actinomycetota bacterium]
MNKAALALGFALLAGMGALILVSGLIMPLWAVAALAALWILAVVAAILWRGRPGSVLAIPFALFAVWLAAAWAGDRFLDWTA